MALHSYYSIQQKIIHVYEHIAYCVCVCVRGPIYYIFIVAILHNVLYEFDFKYTY